MITEDYVSYEIAKLLKEKGFDERVKSYYTESGLEGYMLALKATKNTELGDGFISRPTLQMVMKWLREVHNIHINLDIHWLYFANTLGWMYTITKILENGVDYIDSKGDENDKTFYSSYEEACEAGIKYYLENLI